MGSPLERGLAVIGVLALLAGVPHAVSAQEARPLERLPPKPPEAAVEAKGLIPEPDAIERLSLFFDRRLGNGELANGWFIETGNMVPGAGWLKIGPGYRQWFGKDEAIADASAAISMRGYKMAQGRVEFPRLMRSRVTAGAAARWQDFPDMAHYGEGPDTLAANRTEFSLQSSNLVGYTIFRPVQWFGVGASAGWLKASVNDADDPSLIHTELSLTADTRDFAGRPTRGGLYRVAAANFSDGDGGGSSFKRYEAEAAQFIPLTQSRFVIGLHGWLVGSDTGEGQTVPLYLQPSFGGGRSMRGYSDYRFRDRNMLHLTVETRVALMTHLDVALFMDAGNVAARAGDLDLAKRSYGAGLRLHSRRETFVRVDVARGDEGWRLILALDDPLNLSRLARRTSPAPFVH